jgi:hypothetical protein
MGKYLVIGPSKAGKTALLATLCRASEDKGIAGNNPLIQVVAENEPMRKLIQTARQTIRIGQHPVSATDVVTKLQFKLITRRKLFGFIPMPQQESTFQVWDGPGGMLFPTMDENVDQGDSQQIRAELIDALRESDGFMICFDSSNQSDHMVLAMFEHLPDIMMRAWEGNQFRGRVCFCLTKADALFYDSGTNAKKQTEATSAFKYASDILPSAVMGTLRNYCLPSSAVGFGWTSVYGFLPKGEPNYDKDYDGLRLRRDEQSGINVGRIADNWRPFRVLDPFIFLATGRKGAMEVVKARHLI